MVISIHNIESLNFNEGISIEKYLSRFIYGFVTIYYAYNRQLPLHANEIFNLDANGCLFDYCLYKPDVVKFFRNPHLSAKSLSFLETKPLEKNFIKSLTTEIKLLKIGKFYFLKDWLIKNPIYGIVITFLLSFIFNKIFYVYLFMIISFINFNNF